MRASPAFEAVLPREPAWLIASAGFGLLGALSAGAWAADGSLLRWLLPGAVVIGLGIWCITAWRRVPQRLRWDGRDWWCGSDASSTERPGSLAVAIDLDAWLLLRFDPTATPRRAVWLAASRAGLGHRWPALRRAVYCARPAETEFTATEFPA